MRALGLLFIAACGRVNFSATGTAIDGITLTADNGYLVETALGGTLGAAIATIDNLEESDIADCPVGHGPEYWRIPAAPAFDTIYIFAWDDPPPSYRGVLAQLDTPRGPLPLAMLPYDLCAGDAGHADPPNDLVAMLAACDAGTTTSDGWTDAGGSGEAGTGVWDSGYPVCPGTFVDPTWLWWTDGTSDPLTSGATGNEVLFRIHVQSS